MFVIIDCKTLKYLLIEERIKNWSSEKYYNFTWVNNLEECSVLHIVYLTEA